MYLLKSTWILITAICVAIFVSFACDRQQPPTVKPSAGIAPVTGPSGATVSELAKAGNAAEGRMIDIDEYLRFRQLENRFRGIRPRKRVYAGATITVTGDSVVPSDKYDYLFHPLFGTVVVYSLSRIGKTPLCEQIDAEILNEWRMAKGAHN